MGDGQVGKRRSWSAVVALFGVVVIAGIVLVTAGLYLFGGDTWCDSEVGDSNYGHYEWSWWPTGTRCTYTELRNGFDRVDGPGWTNTTIAIAGLAVGVACLVGGTKRHAAP